MSAVNVHGTAIVIGTRGLIFIGPSGTGKTAAALHCIGQARRRGLFAALVSDDQVLLDPAGQMIVARAPATIAGIAEIRGAGVVDVPSIDRAILSHVIRPVRPPFPERIAPADEDCEILPGHRLPLVRLPTGDGFDSFDRLLLILPFLVRN